MQSYKAVSFLPQNKSQDIDLKSMEMDILLYSRVVFHLCLKHDFQQRKLQIEYAAGTLTVIQMKFSYNASDFFFVWTQLKLRCLLIISVRFLSLPYKAETGLGKKIPQHIGKVSSNWS